MTKAREVIGNNKPTFVIPSEAEGPAVPALLVMHDDAGKIAATFAATQENMSARATGGKKLHIFEHEPMQGAALRTYLGELHQSFRVVAGKEGATLVKQAKTTAKK
jgi:hypothetical protein